MRSILVLVLVLVAGVASLGCKKDGGASGSATASEGATLPASAPADVSTARKLIGSQLELIKRGDVEGLKAGFTARLQDRITDENVERGKAEVAQMSVDELVDSVEGEAGRMKVKMKNGRSLTTLVVEGDVWKADTVWFK